MDVPKLRFVSFVWAMMLTYNTKIKFVSLYHLGVLYVVGVDDLLYVGNFSRTLPGKG